MTANEMFNRLLKDPILKERDDLTEELLNQTQLHSKTDIDIIEVIKLIVQGVEDDTPRTTIYTQVKRNFDL